MRLNWNGVTKENVIDAIRVFEENIDNYPPAKNTFLEFNGKIYPAKHIRALSYKMSFGVEAGKSEFTGGAETAHFFERLGFTVKYAPEAQRPLKSPQSIIVSATKNAKTSPQKTDPAKSPLAETKDSSILKTDQRKDDERPVIIITSTLQSNNPKRHNQNARMEALNKVISENVNSDILLFPAGFFFQKRFNWQLIIERLDEVVSILRDQSSNAIVCLGVDCDDIDTPSKYCQLYIK